MSQDIHVTQLRPTLCSLCLGLRFAEPSRGATTWLRSQELGAGTVQKHVRNISGASTPYSSQEQEQIINISGTYKVPQHFTVARSRNRSET